MRAVRNSPTLVAVVAICELLVCSSVLRAQQPATGPVQQDNVDALKTENVRLAAELKKAQDLIVYQKHLLDVSNAQVLKLSEVHKEKTPTTTPATPEAGQAVMAVARVRSSNNLKTIGAVLLGYANAHDHKGPATLEELRQWADIPTSTFQSPLLNCRYQYIGYWNTMRADEVVAYEDSDDPIRNILFGDGFVEGVPAGRAAQIISDRHK